jgi:hypothetical protein
MHNGTYTEVARINNDATGAFSPRLQLSRNAASSGSPFEAHFEMFSADLGDPQLLTRLRFHQSNEYWGTIGYHAFTQNGRGEFVFSSLNSGGTSLHASGGLILDGYSAGGWLTPAANTGQLFYDVGTARFRISENGSAWHNVMRSTTARTIITDAVLNDPPNIAAGAAANVDIAVVGAVVGDVVSVSPNNELLDGLVIASTRVSAAGVVRIRLFNATAGALDQGPVVFNVSLVQP